MKKPAKRAPKRSAGNRSLRSLGDRRPVGSKVKQSGSKLRSLGDARPVRPS